MIADQRQTEDQMPIEAQEIEVVRPTLRTVFYQDGRMCIERTDGNNITLSRTGRLIKHRTTDRHTRGESISK